MPPRQSVIAVIGDLSWESSAEYYRIINQTIRSRFAGRKSGRCLMSSFDFGEIETLHAGEWDTAIVLMIAAGSATIADSPGLGLLGLIAYFHRFAGVLETSDFALSCRCTPVTLDPPGPVGTFDGGSGGVIECCHVNAGRELPTSAGETHVGQNAVVVP